ncbi:MAG TPA: twin-arginine translocase TatA/TatE family subunit [Beijerinckiaceae bacterium]|nr:twin-arginine translocase TatA/TatE family subunit [Beijerinckiaceae bacterium]
MGGTSIWHWLVVGVIVMLLFGRGKVSELMGDVAKGIKAFKKGMSEEETAAAAAPQPGASEPVRTIEHQSGQTAAPATPVTSEPKAG